MTKLETVINTILQQLKSELANETWESRRRYFNQMLAATGTVLFAENILYNNLGLIVLANMRANL